MKGFLDRQSDGDSELPPVDNEIIVGKERKATSVAEIAKLVDDYISLGRPGLDGRLESNMVTSVPRGHGPGERLTLCGNAALYTLEVVERLNLEGQNLAAVAIQAETLNKMLPLASDLYIPFRRHAFSIVVDRGREDWSLIDVTLNQFVEKCAGNKLKMGGSGLPIHMSQRGFRGVVAKAANSLLERGYVDLNLDNMVAYLLLMARRPLDSGLFSLLQEGWSQDWALQSSLDALVNSCLISEKNKTGDWWGSLQNQNVERLRNNGK